MIFVGPIALFAKSDKPSVVAIGGLTIIARLYQIYFGGLWSAFCVLITYNYALKPGVTWRWVYFVTGFLESAGLIAWMESKERQGESLERQRSIEKGSNLYSYFAWVSYIVFAIWPKFIIYPYGWIVNYLIEWLKLPSTVFT